MSVTTASSVYDCVIIGAGPAGLFAAEKLSEKGLRVAICDQMPSPARKLLMAGLSGLNLTHSLPRPAFDQKYGPRTEQVSRWLDSFGPEQLRHWAQGLGQETYIGASGRVFPTAMKASPLLRAWRQKLSDLSVEIFTKYRWIDITKHTTGLFETKFEVKSGAGAEIVTFQSRSILCATGGASWPRLGSDGSAIEILKRQDIGYTPFQASNCGFYSDLPADFFDKHHGKVLKTLNLTYQDQTIRGSLMITKYGFEGPPLYHLSSLIRRDLAQGPRDLRLDFKPHTRREDLLKQCQNKPRGSASLSTYLSKQFRLKSPISALLTQKKTAAALQDPQTLVQMLKDYPLTLTATAPLTRAISSAGGINFEELSDGLMLHKIPGCFLAGEMIDWEAPTGGYLLQACFSSANLAAQHIVDYLQEPHSNR